MAQHSDHDIEEYRRICKDEVQAITGIEFNAQDQQGRPSLDFHFQQGSGWTFERLVQVLFVHQQMTLNLRSDLLIELYNEEPIHLLRQYEAARELHEMLVVSDNFDPGEDIKRLLEEFPTCLTPALHLPQFNRFLKSLLPIKEGMETTFQRLAIETAGLVLKRIGKSKAFEMYIYNADPEDFYFGIGGRTPFLTGLYYILSTHLGEFQMNVIEYIKSNPRPRYDNRLSTAVSLENMGRQFDEKPIQLAFAPSGSGKTTAIFHELTRYYGYYMVSSALAKYKDIHARGLSASSRDLSETLVDPKVLQGVSEDTRELHTMFNYIKSLNPTDDVDIAMVSMHWWHCIIETRHRVFHWFREALALDSTPALWLSFQLDCSEWDSFLQTFRVISLFPDHCVKTRAESTWPFPKDPHLVSILYPPSEVYKEVRWACIDEAQEDLRVTIRNSDHSSLLALCMSGISILKSNGDDFKYFQQVIFAGTSLNASKAQLTLDKLKIDIVLFGGSWNEITYSVATKFPLVMDRNAAEKVLKLYGLNGAANAVDQSEPLWGRVKWTAMYCEKIIAEIKKGQTKDLDAMSKEDYEKAVRELFFKQDGISFSKLADETYKKIVESLCARLGILQKRGDCRELLDKLLEAAISADILGRPHVFYQESDMELVEQGFAIVESSINQLEFKLEKNFDVISKTNKQLIAKLKKGRPIEDGTVDLLAEINKGFSLVDCTLNDLTAEMVEDGFTIVDCTMDKLASELEEEGFSIVKESKNQLRVQLVKASTMTNNQIDELAKRMNNGFTVKDCMKDKLTTEMVKHGFTIWGGDKRGKLRNLLKEQDITIDKETDYQLTARLEEKFSIVDQKVSKLEARLKKEGFIMVDKTMDQLTEVSKNGFTILGGHKETQLRVRLRGRLSGQGFTVEQETDKRLRVKLKESCTIEDGRRDDLAASLRDSGFIIVNKTIDQLDKLVERPFTIINCSKNELMAKLAERVVIDAIILFFMGHYHLDEKLMTFVRLVTSRTGIGHFTENYLAVQLRQYLSQPTGYENETHGMRLQNTWAERQRQVLDCLAEADNCDDQKLGPLDNFNLVMGDQTVKKFESWRGWVNSFLDWLHAIQNRHKPCASFLIPHNDFGPDLVFALRKRNGGEDKIVLCSIQLKLGRGSIDAVNKSSISWACGDRKAGIEEETQELEAAKKEKEENEKRKKRLEEEARNLESMKNKVKAEEETLKKLGCIENGKDLYTEVVKMVNDGLQKVKGELGNVRKKKDEPKNLSNEAGDTISSDLLAVKNLLENTSWRDKSRLSLLIAAEADTQSHLKGVRPNTSNCDQRREYYAFIGACNTEALFGAPFEAMLGILN